MMKITIDDRQNIDIIVTIWQMKLLAIENNIEL